MLSKDWISTAVDYGDGPGDIGHQYTCTESDARGGCKETCVALHAKDHSRAACATHAPQEPTRCDRCLRPLATSVLLTDVHPDGCECVECRAHCWSEYGVECTLLTGAEVVNAIVQWMRKPMSEKQKAHPEAAWMYRSLLTIADAIEEGDFLKVKP